MEWYRRAKQREDDVSATSFESTPSVSGAHAAPEVVVCTIHHDGVMPPAAYLHARIRNNSI
jgi:hypothetical protein